MKQYIDLHCSCSELVIINKLSNIILTLVSRETITYIFLLDFCRLNAWMSIYIIKT